MMCIKLIHFISLNLTKKQQIDYFLTLVYVCYFLLRYIVDTSGGIRLNILVLLNPNEKIIKQGFEPMDSQLSGPSALPTELFDPRSQRISSMLSNCILVLFVSLNNKFTNYCD